MIIYQTIDVKFCLPRKREHSRWIKEVILSLPNKQQCYKPGDVSIVFCSDNYILSINNQYLKHNYYTDIITFDYSQNGVLSGDLIISVDTIRLNCSRFNTSFNDELHRVIVHGILHLAGFNDNTPDNISEMRKMEDQALSLRNQLLKNLYDK